MPSADRITKQLAEVTRNRLGRFARVEYLRTCDPIAGCAVDADLAEALEGVDAFLETVEQLVLVTDPAEARELAQVVRDYRQTLRDDLEALEDDAGDLPIAADPAPIAPAPAVLGGPPHAADLLRVAGVEYRVVGQPTSVGLVPVQRVYTGDRLAPQLVELYDPATGQLVRQGLV